MKYVIVIIIFIILLNVGFSYKYLSSVFFGDSFDGITSEISKLFSGKKYEHTTAEFFEIVDLLKRQPGIENSYIMSDLVSYAYYSGSKFVYTDFYAGESSDSLIDFIERISKNDPLLKLGQYTNRFDEINKKAYEKIQKIMNSDDWVLFC